LNKINNEYNWPVVIDSYEDFFYECCSKKTSEQIMHHKYIA
jgi:hypothetical protein